MSGPGVREAEKGFGESGAVAGLLPTSAGGEEGSS